MEIRHFLGVSHFTKDERSACTITTMDREQNKRRSIALSSKAKRALPSFGGRARFVPRNIEKVGRCHILSCMLKKAP